MKKRAVVDSLVLVLTIFSLIWLFIASASMDLLLVNVLVVHLWPLAILVLGLLGWQVWSRVIGSWYEKEHHVAGDVFAAFCLLASLVVLAARSKIISGLASRLTFSNVGLLGGDLDWFLLVRDSTVFYTFIVVLLAHSVWVFVCAHHDKAP